MTVRGSTEKAHDEVGERVAPAPDAESAPAAPVGAVGTLLGLQRTAGNRATSEVVRREFTRPQVGVGGPAQKWQPTPNAPSMTALPVVTTMAQLLQLSDAAVASICHDTAPSGRLMAVLRGPFEANWFKAKECLVFGKWPGGEPAFGPDSALRLMTALTVLRGEVHKMVMPLAQAQVRAEMDERAELLKPSFELDPKTKVLQRPERAPARPDLVAALEKEKRDSAADLVSYKGSVGADSVTSDVDVSTGGKNSEVAVRAYNKAFRARLRLDFDPGTVFDLNVYAMDFVHGATAYEGADAQKSSSKDTSRIEVKVEHPDVAVGVDDAARRDEEQEIWSLVHVARFLPVDREWDAFVDQALSVITDPARKAHQELLYVKARARAHGFKDRLDSMMDHLREEIDAGIAELGTSSWGDANKGFGEDALRMRAANRIYEDKLLQVKDLRAQIAVLKAQGVMDSAPLRQLVSEVSGAVSMAQLYANEVYGSGGGTVHAVFGIQTKRKIEALKAGGGKVEVTMPPAQWYETFNDNLGDVLKDHLHFAMPHHDHDEAVPGGAAADDHVDYWYAAFKMGKYADRMLDAVPQLAKGGLITDANASAVMRSPEYRELLELARLHVIEKDGAAKADPKSLKKHRYFGAMNKTSVLRIKSNALHVGATVRGMVALTKPPPSERAPGQSGPDSPGVVLEKIRRQADRTKIALDSATPR